MDGQSRGLSEGFPLETERLPGNSAVYSVVSWIHQAPTFP
jgi:hypothetical protein